MTAGFGRRGRRLGLALVAACWLHGLPAFAAEPVVAFTGSGDAVTETFRVRDGWRAEWETDDERIEIILKSTESGIPSLVANPVDPGQGQAIYARGGTFYFEVQAEGPWRITVLQD